MVPSYETMGDWLEEISQKFPDAFFEELDGASSWRSRPSPTRSFPRGRCTLWGSTATTCWAVHRIVLRLLRRPPGRRGRGDLEG